MIKKFGDFVNEKMFQNPVAEDHRIGDAKKELETSLVHQKFMEDIFGTDPQENDDYNSDSEHDRHRGDLVWIEFYHVPSEAMEAIDKDYDSFAKPFEEWAKKRNLADPSIMTSEDEQGSVMTFRVLVNERYLRDDKEVS